MPHRRWQIEGLRFSGGSAASLLLLIVMIGRLCAASSNPAAKPATGGDDSAHSNPAPKPAISAPGVEAKITIVEFNDFMCPYCSKMVPVMDQLVQSYPGKIQLIVKDFPLDIHRGSELAHEACLAAKAQNKYWEMYHLLFANQKHLERSDLSQYATQLHLNMIEFEKALDDHRYRAEVRESVEEGKALGVAATPTFFLKGRKLEGAHPLEFMQDRVQAALGINQPSDSQAAQGAKAAEDILANSPARGSPDAPVNIVEYADFQCPYCASARNSIEQALREYPGRIKFTFKSFPLDFHADSRLAHQAALAADRQGKFWEMHDLIFAHQRAMKHDDLFAMAKGLGLDMDRFAKDLESDAVRTQIATEAAEGKRKGVQGTPTFYIDGAEMQGAATVAQFEAGIEESLRAKGIEPARVPVAADGGPARGPEHAPVTILWYSDITSPLAISADRLIEQVLDLYPGEVRVVFKNRPLEFHRSAALAHQALMAAAAQGKFWAMHRVLLANQGALAAPDLAEYAGQIGLDRRKFVDDLSSENFREQVQRDVAQARDAGVNGVPVFFINGTRLDGVQTLSSFKAVVDGQIQKMHVAVVHE